MVDITLINSAHPSRMAKLERMFNYFKDISCCKIHVTRNRDTIKFPTHGFNIIETTGNWMHRQNAALQTVKTSYVMLIEEDDIYNFDYIIESVKFLKENKNYVATWGMVYDHKKKRTSIDNIHGMKFSNMHERNYSTSNPFESIVYYLTYMNSFTLHHNVVATNIFRKLHAFLAKHEKYQSFGYIDRLGILAVSAFGNVKTLNCVHVLKDRNGKIRNCPTEKGLEVKPWSHFYRENLEFCKFLARETKLDLDKLIVSVNKTQYLWNKKERIDYDLGEFQQMNKKLVDNMLNKYYS